LCQQPSGVDFCHICLLRLIYPDINRLHKPSATTGNKLYLNAETLNCISNAAEHMDSKRVEKKNKNDSDGCHCDVRREDMLHQMEHCRFVEPGLVLDGVDSTLGMLGQFALVGLPPSLHPCRRLRAGGTGHRLSLSM